jgi:hypothetical protein
MDNLLVGTLSLPMLPSENSLPSVMSSATSSLWKTFRDHRNHRSENRDQLITIIPESVTIFPGILITIIPESRSRSPGIADHHPPESPPGTWKYKLWRWGRRQGLLIRWIVDLIVIR